MGGWFEISTPILPLNRHATDTQLLIFGFKFSKGFFDSFLLLKFRCIHCISCCQFCCISCCQFCCISCCQFCCISCCQFCCISCCQFCCISCCQFCCISCCCSFKCFVVVTIVVFVNVAVVLQVPPLQLCCDEE